MPHSRQTEFGEGVDDLVRGGAELLDVALPLCDVGVVEIADPGGVGGADGTGQDIGVREDADAYAQPLLGDWMWAWERARPVACVPAVVWTVAARRARHQSGRGPGR